MKRYRMCLRCGGVATELSREGWNCRRCGFEWRPATIGSLMEYVDRRELRTRWWKWVPAGLLAVFGEAP